MARFSLSYRRNKSSRTSLIRAEQQKTLLFFSPSSARCHRLTASTAKSTFRDRSIDAHTYARRHTVYSFSAAEGGGKGGERGGSINYYARGRAQVVNEERHKARAPVLCIYPPSLSLPVRSATERSRKSPRVSRDRIRFIIQERAPPLGVRVSDQPVGLGLYSLEAETQ